MVPFYCTDFCSALHQEMTGYLRVSPVNSNVPIKFRTGINPTENVSWVLGMFMIATMIEEEIDAGQRLMIFSKRRLILYEGMETKQGSINKNCLK